MMSGQAGTPPQNGRQGARGVLVFAAGAWSIFAVAAVAAGNDPRVRIEGGADPTGHNYQWTVTNDHTSPIVSVEFPHHRADLFTAPQGWLTKTRHLVGLPNNEEGPPMCSAEAPAPGQGIARGDSATFKMRIAPAGAYRGTGEVKIRFADGETATVAGVALPRPESAWPRYTRLIGTGFIGVLLLLVLVILDRRRRSGQSPPPAVS